MSFIETYVIAALGLVSTMILARLLTPAEIGVFAIGAVIVAVAHLLRDFGVGQYVVQVRELDQPTLRTALALQLTISICIALILVAASGYVAKFYSRDELRMIISLLAINFLVLPFGSILMIWFRREFRSRSSLVANVSGAAAGVVVSTTLAAQDFGFMALVWGALANSGITVVAANLMRPDWFPWLPSFKGVGRMLGFAGYASAANVVLEAAHSANDLVIGKVLGVSDVAIFGKARGMVGLFGRLVMRAVWPVSTAAFAKQRHAGTDLVGSYYTAVQLLTGLAWPFFAFVAIMAYPVVRTLFGTQWDAAVPLVRILAIQGAIGVAHNLIGSILMAHGLVKMQFNRNVVMAGIAVTLLVLSVPHGLERVAQAACLSALLDFAYSTWTLKRVISIRISRVLAAMLPSAVIALSVSAATCIVLVLYGEGINASGWSLIPGGTCALLAWLLAIRVLRHPLSVEARNAVRLLIKLMHR